MKPMSKWLVVAAVVVLGAGCNYGAGAFKCSSSTDCTGGAGGTCEPDGFCSFTDPNCTASGRRYGDLAGSQSNDCVGGQDAGTDAPPDAQLCFGTGLVRICLQTPPTAPLTISTSTMIDTDSSSMCAPIASGGNYCVLAATTISVEALLRATGSRPLVLVASDSIAVSNTIDVGSHRGASPETGAGADPATCAAGTSPGTSGGGAGGTFAGIGGTGGSATTGTGGTPALAPALTELQGGCAGQDGQDDQDAAKGVRGHGGGAVFLIAGNTIDVGGGINAAGEGGSGGARNDSGGGGGGSGGMIGFDAPTIRGSGLILANGGGGGGGSNSNNSGGAGSDPSGITAAPGGKGVVNIGGDGGAGSAGLPAGPGVNGANDAINDTGGGGGGGGGAGLVKAPATANLGTQVSPPPTP
jgi:hypothetical protein